MVVNNDNAELDEECNEHQLEDLVIGDSTIEEIDSNEDQDNREALVEADEEINENASIEVDNEVRTEDDTNSLSNAVEDC